jgi:hypothetical protein
MKESPMSGIRLLSIFGSGLLIASCGGGETVPIATDVGPRLSVYVPTQHATLAQLFNSGMTAKELFVVRNAPEWTRVWSRMHGAQQPLPVQVQPDFATEVALVAAMGEKPSGGFEIVIDSVTRHEHGSIVYVTEKTPGPSCITTGALTQPVHALRAPRSDVVLWRERTLVVNC